MLNSEYLQDYKTEKRDSFLLALLLHILFLAICLLPLLDLSIQPKEPLQGILVVFDQEFTQKEEKSEVIESTKSSSSQEAEKPTTQKEVVNKSTKASKVITPKEVVTVSHPTVNLKTESPSKEVEVVIDEAKIKAEREAKLAAEAAEDLKNKKSMFGALFGDSNSRESIETGESKPSTSTLEGSASDSGSANSNGGLGSRGILYKPSIEDKSNKEGRVIVKICVDNSGKVISSDFVQSGSTTTDTQLIQKALEGARQYKFAVLESQSTECGNITIDFILK